MTDTAINLSRRAFVAGGLSLGGMALAGCSGSTAVAPATAYTPPPEVLSMYAAMPDEQFPLPAVDLRQMDPAYYRTVVPNHTGEGPGTIVVDTNTRYLYLTRDDGTAMRYGVGIGAAGFEWSGRGYIARKAQWPVWTPPSAMIEREPHLEEFRNGMPPGLTNPLGARALYIYQNGQDTLYRLHGTPEYWTIGHAVSSGCVRLVNQDIIDLHSRTPTGTNVVVV